MAIIKRKNKRSTAYQVKVRDPSGDWYPSLAFATQEEAEIEEARLITLKHRGGKAPSRDARLFTVNQYWEVWSVENRTDVSPGWKLSQDQMYRDYVKPWIGSLRVREVGTPEVGSVLNRMKEAGLSDQMRKHVYSLLRKMFGDAVEYYEMLPASPVKAKFHRPKVPQAKRRFLRPVESWGLMERIQGHYLGPAIWTQLLAGLRPGEVQALRGDCLMFDRGQILIRAAYNPKTKRIQEYPKQGDWAYAPMAPVLRDYLKGLNKKAGDFVATGPDGERMLSYTTYHRALKRVCKEAKVSIMTPHELRHSCATLWIEAGASQMDLQRLLCHKPGSGATMRYIHQVDDRLQERGNVLMFPKMFPNGGKQTYVQPGQDAQKVK